MTRLTRFSPDTRVRVVKDRLAIPGRDRTGREGLVLPDEPNRRALIRLDGKHEALYFDDDELEAIPAELIDTGSSCVRCGKPIANTGGGM